MPIILYRKVIIVVTLQCYINAESPYDPDSEFSVTALSRLEDVGIKIESALVENLTQLLSVVGIALDKNMEEGGSYLLKNAIAKWKHEKAVTWRILLEDVLPEMDLKDLSLQIGDYLTG